MVCYDVETDIVHNGHTYETAFVTQPDFEAGSTAEVLKKSVGLAQALVSRAPYETRFFDVYMII